MSTLYTLASGSSGNAMLLSQGTTHLLIDAGISCRRIVTALASLGLQPSDLSGICITHSHTDHVSGLKTLSKKHKLPIYLSHQAAEELSAKIPETAPYLRCFSTSTPFYVEDLLVQTFSVPHDAAGTVGYRIGDVGVLTDCGYVTQEMAETLFGVSLLVLESNHDVEMVQSGPYPYYLKQRVLGDDGHLSNDHAAQFAQAMVHNGAATIILAHLSQDNNTPQTALRTVCQALEVVGLRPTVEVAPRDVMSRKYETTEVLCKK
ncbi:MBL fold metallo-hydrolase [Bengtsoniella intestinalis]|uniref:MBL fold metallo-hydrolase n=1 Tax=Bengtsoniella intestinalis TaxID=3073143 RepID=UPI00391F15E0